jgi:filamentous hemagglutinin family protein
MAFLATAMAAYANPTAPTVVMGSATFSSSGNTLTVTNTNATVINWQTFNIAPGETTRFVQPNASSAVVNRLPAVGARSEIHGTLTSNGRVFIVNGYGTIIGAGAQVSTAGLFTMISNPEINNIGPGPEVVAPAYSWPPKDISGQPYDPYANRNPDTTPGMIGSSPGPTPGVIGPSSPPPSGGIAGPGLRAQVAGGDIAGDSANRNLAVNQAGAAPTPLQPAAYTGSVLLNLEKRELSF